MRRITTFLLLLSLMGITSWAQDYGEGLITSADQLYSECTESTEGTDLGALLDNDPETYWHTAWSGNVPPYPHWIQINLNAPVEGDLIVYMLRRKTLEDHPAKIKLTCASSSDFTDENIIAEDVEMSNPSSGEEGYSTTIHLSAPVQYVRIYATLMSRLSGYNAERCWHAAELQLYNPSDENIAINRLEALLEKYDRWYQGEKFNTGTDCGQYSDIESADRFYECLNTINDMLAGVTEVTVETVSALESKMDELYNKIIASEVLYSLPANGYYRIIANKNYYEERETGDVDPETGEPITETVNGIVKSLYANVDGYAGWHTMDRESGFDLWQLTVNEDNTINMTSAVNGNGFQNTTDGSMTNNPEEFITMGFDFAGRDPATGRVILYIRNSAEDRDKTGTKPVYLHQLGHQQGAGKEGRLCQWIGTYQNDLINQGDWGTCEWYLEPVSDEEAQAILGTLVTYTITFDTKGGEPISEMVMMPNQTLNIPTPVRDGYIFTGWTACDEHGNELESLPETMPEMNLVLTAKWRVLGKALITGADQLYSECSDIEEGQHLEYLLDGDPSTFWHTDWHGNVNMTYHWIQINLDAPVEGDFMVYMKRRLNNAAHPIKIRVTTASSMDFTDETTLAEDIEISNPTSGADGYSTPIHLQAPAQYIRIYSTRRTMPWGEEVGGYWHAAELQLYSVRVEGDEAEDIEALQKELAQYAAVEVPVIDSEAEVVANTEYDLFAVVKAVADAKAALESTDVATLTSVLEQAKAVVDPYIQNCEANGPAISCLYTMNEEWGTLILPFGFYAPLDWTLYSCNGLKEDGVTLEVDEQYYGGRFTPYIVHGVPGARIQFIGHAKGQWYSQVQKGIIVGVLDGPYTPRTGEYVMQKQQDVIGFYRVNTENSTPVVEPFHCYLSLPNAAAKVIRWEGITDGIEIVDAENGENETIYNLQGQRLMRRQSGVNIVNGKKVLSK